MGMRIGFTGSLLVQSRCTLLGCQQQRPKESEAGPLDGKQMRVVDSGAALPHELGQAEQVLHVVARLPLAHCDLSSDLLRTCRTQVGRVVFCSDVN